MTASETSVDIVARLLAIGGFAISALGFLYLVLKDRRKISVKAEDLDRYRADGDMESVLGVTVVNTGHRPITIVGYSLAFSGGIILYTGVVYKEEIEGPYENYGRINCTVDSDNLNKRIEDGESMRVFFDYDDIGFPMADRKATIGADVELKAIYAYDAENKKRKAKLQKYLKETINALPSEWSYENPGNGPLLWTKQ